MSCNDVTQFLGPAVCHFGGIRTQVDTRPVVPYEARYGRVTRGAETLTFRVWSGKVPRVTPFATHPIRGEEPLREAVRRYFTANCLTGEIVG